MSSPSSLVELHLGANSVQAFDLAKVRSDFPILTREIHGRPLVYLDNAASAQKPRQVLEAMQDVHERHYANVHRGAHTLSQEATDLFEQARVKAQRFINAADDHEIVFTRGGTEAINLVAASYGRGFLTAGDEVIISYLEHHSNIVPWQLLRDQIGIEIKVVPVDDDGAFMLEEYQALLGPKTKLVAVTHISNALGSVTPVAELIRLAHDQGAKVLLDGCQAVPHQKVDVQALDVDFYAFSSHKIYGPTGIGVLYGKRDLLNAMPPYQGGGEMILSVSFEKSVYQESPHRFEAGTPAIVEAVGMGAAMDYLEALGLENVAAHEAGLLAYGTERLSQIPGLRIIGTAKEKAGIISFVLDGIHAHDIGTIVDRAGVAVRTGHHCAEPLMHRFGVSATARASFGLYNTLEEVDALADSIVKVQEIFG